MAGFQYCPFCRADLAPLDVRLSERTLTAEVQRDTSAAGGLLVGLGLLATVGLMMFVCSGGGAGLLGINGILVCGVVLLGLVIAGMVLGASGRDRGAAVGTSLFGGLAIGLMVAGLTLTIIAAMIISFLEDCGKACGGSPPRRSAAPPPGSASMPVAGYGTAQKAP
jgi:hypothetical protein